MDYFIRKALYYYFMLGEITETDYSVWVSIARKFGVSDEQAEVYGKIISNDTLKELSSCMDIRTYKNYLAMYCADKGEFGNSDEEAVALDCKAEALERIAQIFNNAQANCSRLGALAHKYEGHHTAAVLYSLAVLCLNDNPSGVAIATEILFKELRESKNSAAGIVLLNLTHGNEGEIMSYLCEMPDMRVLPEVLGSLVALYGGGDAAHKSKRAIGF